MVDQPTWGIRQLSSLHELGAQLGYLVEKKGEARNGGQLLNTTTDGVRQEKGECFTLRRRIKGKGEARYCGPLFNKRHRRVKRGKRLIASLYVDELLS